MRVHSFLIPAFLPSLRQTWRMPDRSIGQPGLCPGNIKLTMSVQLAPDATCMPHVLTWEDPVGDGEAVQGQRRRAVIGERNRLSCAGAWFPNARPLPC